MKHIFTIILATAATIGTASAQSHSEKNIAYNDHTKNSYFNNDHGGYDNSNAAGYLEGYNSYKGKQEQLERISREYDQKIAFVKNDHHLTWRQKEKQIDWLQDQRKNEMRQVELHFSNHYHKAVDRKFGQDQHR